MDIEGLGRIVQREPVHIHLVMKRRQESDEWRLAVLSERTLASCKGCWQLAFGSFLLGARRTPAPPLFRMLAGQPFVASGVLEVQLLSHSPCRAWPCVSGAQVCVVWRVLGPWTWPRERVMPGGLLNLVIRAQRVWGGERQRFCWAFCRALIHVSHCVVGLCSGDEKASPQGANERCRQGVLRVGGVEQGCAERVASWSLSGGGLFRRGSDKEM